MHKRPEQNQNERAGTGDRQFLLERKSCEKRLDLFERIWTRP